MHFLLYSCTRIPVLFSFFFFNDTATTEIYTLSLHDALPISVAQLQSHPLGGIRLAAPPDAQVDRSEEHTSELQSRSDLVCRLLLEKKKKKHSTSFRNAPNNSKYQLSHEHAASTLREYRTLSH